MKEIGDAGNGRLNQNLVRKFLRRLGHLQRGNRFVIVWLSVIWLKDTLRLMVFWP